MPTDLLARTERFALQAIDLYRLMDGRERAARRLSNQFLSAATSIGANLEEAQAAESRADFIHKHRIALKEARETHYWLRLLSRAQLAPPQPTIIVTTLSHSKPSHQTLPPR